MITRTRCGGLGLRRCAGRRGCARIGLLVRRSRCKSEGEEGEKVAVAEWSAKEGGMDWVVGMEEPGGLSYEVATVAAARERTWGAVWARVVQR